MSFGIIGKLFAIVWVSSLLCPHSVAYAAGLTVSAGCDAPSQTTSGRTFYIDPVHGNMENDGSKARPWRSLAEVVSASRHLISSRAYTTDIKKPRELQPINPNAPVKQGDTLALMSGDHGDVDLRQFENADFISIVAGENQTPVVRSLRVISSSHWLFRGLKFQNARTTQDIHAGMVDVVDSAPYGTTDNIIFVGNSFSTQDDVTGWSDADWVSKPFEYSFMTRSRCTALFGNHFYNMRNAGMIAGDGAYVAENLIEFVGNDGFDIMASDLTLRHNIIRSGRHSPAEPMHADGIQGWSLKGATNRNVRIEANMVIDTSQSDNNYMQGISIFDGQWDGMEVVNNVVLTNTWQGIALYGVNNARVVNNTVVPARRNKYMTWIVVRAGKEKRPSSHVVIRNNIAGQITAGGVDVEADHNIVLTGVSPARTPNSDVASAPAKFSFTLDQVPLESLFKRFDMTIPAYDLRLAPQSLAREAGSADGAPSTDVEGRLRTPPIDIGAYAR